jgi:hypothetical protein
MVRSRSHTINVNVEPAPIHCEADSMKEPLLSIEPAPSEKRNRAMRRMLGMSSGRRERQLGRIKVVGPCIESVMVLYIVAR